MDEESLYFNERQRMVEEQLIGRDIRNRGDLDAMRSIPRHLFVLLEHHRHAYSDGPLPIGGGQTISQPYIVAWMTELLELQPGEKVLEIGTGSGYQAAVLAELGFVEVYSIEIVPELASSAQERLDALGYTDLNVRQGDGYYGWPEQAAFDAIIVTAAPDHLPSPLAAQLAEGGRLVIPIGPPGGYQSLWKFVKEGADLKAYNRRASRRRHVFFLPHGARRSDRVGAGAVVTNNVPAGATVLGNPARLATQSSPQP